MSDLVHLVAAVGPISRASVSPETFHMGMPWTTVEEHRQWKREKACICRADDAVVAQKQTQEPKCRQQLRTNDHAAFQAFSFALNLERDCKRWWRADPANHAAELAQNVEHSQQC